MKKFALGLMSGTSCDGVSLALASFPLTLPSPPKGGEDQGEGVKIKTFAYQTFPYPPRLRRILLSAHNLKAPELSRLNFILGNFFADCILQFLKGARHRVPGMRCLAPSDIAVIGSHGHTIYHGPRDRPANTLQIGEASVIAEKIGIPVVSDFRTQDMAAGGEGAPLIPFFDHYFFGNGSVTALQNIGGIANVTVVGKNIRPIAFDNGPGNCLIDWAVQKVTKGKILFDRNGAMARRGKINGKVVEQMASHPYFRKRPPKSTGRELFNEKFIPKILWKDNPKNAIATLTYFTAYSIYDSYQKFILPKVPGAGSRVPGNFKIIASGGGVLNKTLMAHLKNFFSGKGDRYEVRCVPVPFSTIVHSIEEFGIPAQAKEPLAFAFFALRALEGKTNHLPAVTGARKECVLGKITISSPSGRGLR